MCGGVYEEEFEVKEYKGPSTQFKTIAGFSKAVAICEKKKIKCRVDPAENMIHFETTKEEERFSIAFSLIGAGSVKSKISLPTVEQLL